MRFLTAGESHGEYLVGIIEGFPSNLYLNVDYVNNQLKRRQMGYGRSSRMSIERDQVIVLSGVSDNLTTGNPISLLIKNRGRDIDVDKIIKPRPGHGDLAGMLKYNHQDAKHVMERASARETAMRVAIGSICRLLLKEFNISIYSHVVQIGKVKASDRSYEEEALLQADQSPLRVLDKEAEKLMIEEIERAKDEGDTLGGIFEVIAKNLPVGLGSYASWDRRLDSSISAGIMSIPGIKGIEFGLGFDLAKLKGSQVHDEIYYDQNRYFRKTNNAGGTEAGVSNGEDIVFRAVMKPIPTLRKPLRTVNVRTKEEVLAQFVRSDVCAVPSASVVAENILAYVLAKEIVMKFGGDSMEELKANYNSYVNSLQYR
ncbi:MAG: chorismate synthase [Tissierellia bacterium]|nr:chorismate synthase [Tissierellia bacterium]